MRVSVYSTSGRKIASVFPKEGALEVGRPCWVITITFELLVKKVGTGRILLCTR